MPSGRPVPVPSQAGENLLSFIASLRSSASPQMAAQSYFRSVRPLQSKGAFARCSPAGGIRKGTKWETLAFHCHSTAIALGFESLSPFPVTARVQVKPTLRDSFSHTCGSKYSLFCKHLCLKEMNPAHNSYTGPETQHTKFTHHREMVGAQEQVRVWGWSESRDSRCRRDEE